MKKQDYRIFISLMLIAFISLSVNADKWRVNNTGGIDADYTNLQTAINNAAHGDTIYVEPSSTSYGDITINDKITLIGPGYFITENPETQANPGSAIVDLVTINGGGDTTLITGMTINETLQLYSYITSANSLNNVIITRNKIFRIYFNNYSTSGGANNLFLQNYIYNSTSSLYTIDIEAYFDNTLFQNNFIANTYSSYFNCIDVDPASAVSFTNNVISGDVLNAPTTIFENNIFIDATMSDISSPGSFSYNITNLDILPAGNNNDVIADLTTIFDETCPTCSSTDGQYQIDTLSAAATHATDGGQCGMFGGTDPYVLSGIPAVPAIFYFQSPSSGSAATGLPVTIRIKSHK